MTVEPSKRPRRQRTLQGLRVEAYRKAAGWQQNDLAAAIGVSPIRYSDMLAGGNRPFPLATLQSIADALGNCSLPDFLAEDVLTQCGRVAKTFAVTFSAHVGEGWYLVSHSDWHISTPAECLLKTTECFELLVAEARAFSTSADAFGIAATLAQAVVFAERARQRNVRAAQQLSFDLCDRLSHCYSTTEFPELLSDKVAPYLRIMKSIVKVSHDKQLARRLHYRQADVLKICGSLGRAKQLLRVGHDLGAQNDPFAFEGVRNHIIVGTKTAGSEQEFRALVQMGERALDGCGSLEGQRHILHSLGEAHAHRFSKVRTGAYHKMARECHERAASLEAPFMPTEIMLRVKKMALTFATHRIADLVHFDGREVEELKRLARVIGSPRVARETDALEAELKRKKIISG